MKTNNSAPMGKPKGPIPSLISGKNPKKVTVIRKSKCPIMPDENCFSVPRSGWGILSPKKYCKICFDKIIEQTQKDLDKIRNF